LQNWFVEEVKSGKVRGERCRSERGNGARIWRSDAIDINVDVYVPALQALCFITPAFVNGALVMFDDYDQMAADDNRGERRALREWLAETGFRAELYRSYATFGRTFIIHKSHVTQPKKSFFDIFRKN
jgi:hypothetical protein